MLYQHLYVHIPFCQRRCSYCDFNTFANSEGMMAAYCAALAREIRALGSGEWEPDAGGAALLAASAIGVATGDNADGEHAGAQTQPVPRRAQGIAAGLAAPAGGPGR